LAAARTPSPRHASANRPVVRAVIAEILTAHFFVSRPHYMKTMQKLAEIGLRI
jgi:hypothetical protein